MSHISELLKLYSIGKVGSPFALVLSCLLPLLFSGPNEVKAQDTHYWSHKFGAANTLLSGGDDATCTDNSAIINNPGNLGFSTNSSLSITTNAYSLENIKLKDAAGPGLDMQSTTPSIIPLVLAGAFKHKRFPRWTVGYILAEKERYSFKASQRFDAVLNVIEDSYSAGDEEFVAQTDLRDILSETWAGIGIAYKINEHLSAGFSNLGAYREHNASSSYAARAVVNQPGVLNLVSSNFLYDVSYYSVRSIFKLGLSYKGKRVDAGIAVTLPGFHVYSDATINSDVTGVNVLIDDSAGTRGSFVANDRQTGLKARFKSPASISGGLNFKLSDKTRICVAAEYFFGLSPYVIIEPKQTNFIRPAGSAAAGSRELLSIASANRPVFNIAIGAQTKIFKQYHLLFGVQTNNSFHTSDVEEKGNDLALSKNTIYHASLGVMVRRSKSDICIGVTAGYGRGNNDQLSNLNNPADNVNLSGELGQMTHRFWGLAGILGYVHYLK
jgi:hypothetical protein